MDDELKRIFARCGTPKGRAGFAEVYAAQIGPRRLEPLRILELGIYRGASIEAWLQYCPAASITGIDTFRRVAPESVKVLEHPRVSWYRLDSTLQTIFDARLGHGAGPFDFIIDDACHWHDAQRKSFSNYFPQLAAGGVYYIEDVWPFDAMMTAEKRHPWIEKHPGAWTDETWAALLAEVSQHTVTRHDFRQTAESPGGDRYMLEIRP